MLVVKTQLKEISGKGIGLISSQISFFRYNINKAEKRKSKTQKILCK